MTYLIPVTLAVAAWYSTERRVGTRDEWVALLGALFGWVVVATIAVLAGIEPGSDPIPAIVLEIGEKIVYG